MLPIRRVAVSTLTVMLIVPCVGICGPVEEAIDLIATRLDAIQVKEGPSAGVYGVGDVVFVGPSMGGMACAYGITGNEAYKASAELGAEYVAWIGGATGNILGDEAAALVRVSEINSDPVSNKYRTLLIDFYESLRPDGKYDPNTTKGYIDLFSAAERSTAVFYLANHLLAAWYVDDVDKDVWRDGLIRYLSRIDDTARYPVMAVGVATWAFANAGGLDDTPVSSVNSSPLWDGVLLSDLPGLLASHQVPAGEPYAGSFYWRFDHTTGGPEGPVAGYTEDAVFATLGLTAASVQLGDEAGAYDEAIVAARDVLLAGVDSTGVVHEHLSGQGEVYNAFAGEMLQALCAVHQYLPAEGESAALGVNGE